MHAEKKSLSIRKKNPKYREADYTMNIGASTFRNRYIGTGAVMQMREAKAWTRLSTVAGNFRKHGGAPARRITLFVLERLPQIFQWQYHRTLFSFCLSPFLSFRFSCVVNPTRTRGWIPACPRSQGPPRRNYERDENRRKRERPNVFHVRSSYSRFRPVLSEMRAITPITKEMGCREFYCH